MHLEKAPFDKKRSSDWYLDNPYSFDNCFVSLKNGKLFISDSEENPKRKTFLYSADNGYFIGINLGHYDGWVRYYPYMSTYPEAEEPKLVCDEHCHGFEETAKNTAYLFTVFPNPDSNRSSKEDTHIWVLSPDPVDYIWSWEVVGTVEGTLEIYYYDESEQLFYLFTTCGVFEYKLKDRMVTKRLASECLPYLDCNSAVRIGDAIFCGSSLGVYSFDLTSDCESWYPVYYEKYIKK